MKTETHFFATRTLARANAEVLNGKVKDFGTTAEAGKRWAVLVEVPEVDIPVLKEVHKDLVNTISEIKEMQEAGRISRISTNQEVAEMEAMLIGIGLRKDADTIANQRPGIIGEETLKTPNNKPVVVSWRRSMVAVRLRNHMANAS